MTLTLEAANAIIAAALAEAARQGARPLAVAVLDPAGHVVSLQRQDGASMFRIDIATGKAWGAVAMGLGGRTLHARAQDHPAFFNALAAASGGRLLPQPGGVLVRGANDAIHGAVGVSGDSGERDETFAVAGITAAGFTPDTG